MKMLTMNCIPSTISTLPHALQILVQQAHKEYLDLEPEKILT